MPNLVIEREASPNAWHEPEAAGGWFDVDVLTVGAAVGATVTYPQLERFQPRGLERGCYTGAF